MFNIVLYNPQIPPNTGNIMRLCANTGCQLHLIEPYGFSLDDKALKRAGMDYLSRINYQCHKNFDSFMQQEISKAKNSALKNKMFLCTTKAAKFNYAQINYTKDDYFIFGNENSGLPNTIHQQFSEGQKIKIPMRDTGRSLNLATAVGIIIYEAWRQLGFCSI